MRKRKKVIQAGSLVLATISTPPAPRDPEHVRAAKSKMTTESRRALNLKAAYRRLELLLAANFTPSDTHLTLTYSNEHLPATRKEALKRVRKFLSQLRAYRKARGLPLKYVYVTEGKHGDKRLHHHLVINAVQGDYDVIRSLWIYGEQIQFERISDREYADLARYITKESADGKPNGAQLWTASKGLAKPTVEVSWIDENETLAVPAGCFVLERQEHQNEYGSFTYIKYRIEAHKPRKVRPRRTSRQTPPQSPEYPAQAGAICTY